MTPPRLERDPFRAFDLIVASPTYVGPEGRDWNHTRLVLECANDAHDWTRGPWPFDLEEPPAIVKTAPTDPMVRTTSWKARHAIASGPLRRALSVPRPARTAGKRILVYDDVFTDGLTMNEVARCLREQGGAASVCGVTLARQPFRAR